MSDKQEHKDGQMMPEQPKNYPQDDAKLPNLKGAFWLAKILACAGLVFFGFEYLFYYGDVARIEGWSKNQIINGVKNPYQIEKLKCNFSLISMSHEDNIEKTIGYVMIFKISDKMADLTIENNGRNLNGFKPTYYGRHWIFPRKSDSITVADKNYYWQPIHQIDEILMDYAVNPFDLDKKIKYFLCEKCTARKNIRYSYLVASECPARVVNFNANNSYRFLQIQRDYIYLDVIDAGQKELIRITFIGQLNDFFRNHEQGVE